MVEVIGKNGCHFLKKYLMKEECSKKTIEEMKGRPLFVLLSNEMNRTRTKRREERESVRREGEENSAFV